MHGSIQEPWTDLCMCVCLVCVLSLVLLISYARFVRYFVSGGSCVYSLLMYCRGGLGELGHFLHFDILCSLYRGQ